MRLAALMSEAKRTGPYSDSGSIGNKALLNFSDDETTRTLYILVSRLILRIPFDLGSRPQRGAIALVRGDNCGVRRRPRRAEAFLIYSDSYLPQ